MVKAASGVAVLLTGTGLDLIGLHGNAEDTGPVADQSAGTLLSLRLMMTVLPMVVLAVALALFHKKSTLTDQRVEEIGQQLRVRGGGNGYCNHPNWLLKADGRPWISTYPQFRTTCAGV